MAARLYRGYHLTIYHQFMTPSITVIYLSWIPYGIDLFKDFAQSYLLYEAGCPHKLVIIFNGVESDGDTEQYIKYALKKGLTFSHLSYRKGQDLEVYRNAASEISTEFVLFLNSYSIFQSGNWLQKYVNAYSELKIGIVGATGSFQSYYSTYRNKFPWRWNKQLNFKENINNYKLKLKALLLWRFYFKPYPNPHIRTNAFFINRKLFLSLHYKIPHRKFDAYAIESGKHSITRQILKMGLGVLIIDKYEKAYEIGEWKNSRIFWTDNQEDLLISDNQTRYYDNADSVVRKYLSNIAWGK